MEWIPDLPSETVMQYMVSVWFICALLIAVGIYYHEAMWAFLVLFSFHYFSVEENYLNHHWVIIVFTASLSILPAADSYSLGAYIKTGHWKGTGHSPRWVRWYLAAHLDIVYLYGSAAKVNIDWLRAAPLYNWLWFKPHTMPSWWKPMFDWWAFPYLLSYGGIVWDGIGPFLLRLPGWWRLPGILGSALFHGFNRLQFNIGVFPYMSSALSTLYLPPDWPWRFFVCFRHFILDPTIKLIHLVHIMFYGEEKEEEEEEQIEVDERPTTGILLTGHDEPSGSLRRRRGESRDRHIRVTAQCVENGSLAPPRNTKAKASPTSPRNTKAKAPPYNSLYWKLVFFICCIFILFQILMPIRNHLMPSLYQMGPAWSDEGHEFSWRMKLRDRNVNGAYYVAIHVLGTNQTYQYQYDSPALDLQPGRTELNGKVIEHGIPQTSWKTWGKIKSRPSMARRYAVYLQKFLVEDYKLFKNTDVEVDVRGKFESSLNFRPYAPIITPDIPLCDPDLSWWAKDWLEPEPYMPDSYREQYPWVFLPMLLRGEDSPCTPWHGIQMTRKIEDACELTHIYHRADDRGTWEKIGNLCQRWEQNEESCLPWANEHCKRWDDATKACDEYAANRTWTPAFWERIHGGFTPSSPAA